MSKRLATGAGWVLASRIAISGFGLAGTIILARLLAPEDFGLVAIVTTISAIVAAITQLSLSQALVQHPDPQEAHYNTAFTFNLLRALAVALVLVGLSWPVAAIYGDPRLVPLLIVVGAGSLIGGFNNPRLAKMMRDLVFWQDFALRLGERFFAFTVAVAVALIWESYWALIVGMLAGQAVAMVLSYVILPYRPRLDISKWRELFSFSIWLTLGQLVNTLNWQFDHLVVGYVLGTRELGFYSVGSRLANMPTREATQPVAQVTFPGFTKIADDLPRLRSAYTRAQTLLTAIALAMGIGFAVAAEPLVLLVMGEKWLPIVPVIQVLSGVFAIQTIGTPAQPLCMALGRTRTLFNRSLLTLAIRVPIVIAGLVMGGLPGLLVARAITGLIGLGINIWLVSGLIGLSAWQQIFDNRRSIISAGVMALAVWGVGTMFGDVAGGALALKVLAMCATIALVFPVTLFAMWYLSGRPSGPEEDIMKGVRKVQSHLRGAR